MTGTAISPNELTGLCLYYCMINSQWHWQTPKSWTKRLRRAYTSYDSSLDEIRIRCIMEVELSL